jgi:DUF971 family protein
MNAQPTRLSLVSERELAIDWDDGERRVYAIDALRRSCPCATCQAQRPDPSPPSPLPPVEPGLTIRHMDPVGNYAYRILFSDGHETGIFTLELLRELGAQASR